MYPMCYQNRMYPQYHLWPCANPSNKDAPGTPGPPPPGPPQPPRRLNPGVSVPTQRPSYFHEPSPYPSPVLDSSSQFWQMMPMQPDLYGAPQIGPPMDMAATNPFFRALMQQQEAADNALKTRRVDREQCVEWHVSGGPWFRPEDILVSVEGRHVMLTAKKEEKGNCSGVPEDCGLECGYTVFRQAHRCFTLPDIVDSSDVRAQIQPGADGQPALIITVPKLAYRRLS
ncbi:hypothetical protein BIW11_05690 [Tropilaelaps mercedesae]|uniref:SHSP domain-containing protein n=1 Tax=Tropilaelaps mercedesae TaxID=418985 RepID=A0A1V9Y198_9ACAR|nr:hypothetical protein BIW11_05690 [Tropilaelaps mercedesae]